jgi:hypothetical protein
MAMFLFKVRLLQIAVSTYLFFSNLDNKLQSSSSVHRYLEDRGGFDGDRGLQGQAGPDQGRRRDPRSRKVCRRVRRKGQRTFRKLGNLVRHLECRHRVGKL